MNSDGLNSKKIIYNALESNDMDRVVALINKQKKSLSILIRLSYDKETVVGWRAIKAIGLIATAIARTEHAFLRETIRKLLWHLTDESGGIGWSAPEIIGEIVAGDPEGFKDIIPLIAEVYDIEEKVFRPGVMYALGRIARISPKHIVPFHEFATRGLNDSDPVVRALALSLAAEIMGQLENSDRERIAGAIKGLSGDRSEVWLYRNDSFVNVQIGEEVQFLKSKVGLK